MSKSEGEVVCEAEQVRCQCCVFRLVGERGASALHRVEADSHSRSGYTAGGAVEHGGTATLFRCGRGAVTGGAISSHTAS